MVQLSNDFISASAYNKLPFINDVHNEPDERPEDLKDLKAILSKHKIPDTICVKLLHIHFELKDNEIMAFKNVPVPPHGEIETLGPHDASSATSSTLTGAHYFINDTGNLEAFEYMEGPAPDMSVHQAFLDEYTQLIVSRGLQRVFGLSLRPDEQEQGAWTELEYPEKRMTFLIPGGIELPDVEWRYVVTTKWDGGIIDIPTRHGHHTHHAHMVGRSINADEEDNGLYFGDKLLEVGSPFQRIYSSVIKAY